MLNYLQKHFLKKLVASDEFGNKYYQYGSKRWVSYANMHDPSVVPPLYYLWLHGTVDSIDILSSRDKYEWEKAKKPNLTGTDAAYLPEQHILRNPKQDEKLDYMPWRPTDE